MSTSSYLNPHHNFIPARLPVTCFTKSRGIIMIKSKFGNGTLRRHLVPGRAGKSSRCREAVQKLHMSLWSLSAIYSCCVSLDVVQRERVIFITDSPSPVFIKPPSSTPLTYGQRWKEEIAFWTLEPAYPYFIQPNLYEVHSIKGLHKNAYWIW